MRIVIIILILFILLYCFAIFPETSRQKRMKAFHGIMFAHRGLHSKAHGIPENSMAAFKAAIQKNYGIELDLHLTRDGKLVVFHDDDLKRVCGRPERPEDLTAEELTKCTLLGTSEHIPLFRDVLALVNAQVPLLVELKIPERNMQICKEAYEMLRTYHGAYLLEVCTGFGKMLRKFCVGSCLPDSQKKLPMYPGFYGSLSKICGAIFLGGRTLSPTNWLTCQSFL